jgi:anti-sigma B factor antagonist
VLSSIASALVIPLAPPATAERLAALRAAVSSALSGGAIRVTVDVDGLAVLDSLTIATLISALREARERGGTVALAVARKSLLETLRITALDRVFEIVSPEPELPPSDIRALPATPLARARRRPRFASAIVGALFAVAAVGGRVAAQETETPVQIVRSVIDANPSLRSYQARVHVDVRMTSFPFIAPHLDGATYFKRPNNYEVVFERVPSYAKGFDRLYSDIGDPSNWERRFTMTVAGGREVDGHHDVVLRLVQRVRGMIDHQDVAIDPANQRIDAMEWHYYNGGTITMTQTFAGVGGFNVLAAQHATIRIPHVRAVAEARYFDYHTNVALDDAVFTKTGK